MAPVPKGFGKAAPRARGRAVDHVIHGCGDGGCPARAGASPMKPGRTRARTGLPRARGGEPALFDQIDPLSEIAPPLRGFCGGYH